MFLTGDLEVQSSFQRTCEQEEEIEVTKTGVEEGPQPVPEAAEASVPFIRGSLS